MAEIVSVIEPAPGGDGPYVVVTRKNNSVTNVTTGIGPTGLTGISAAIDQAKTDQAAAVTGTYLSTTITTQTT